LPDFDPYQPPPSALDETVLPSHMREPIPGEGAPASRLSRFIVSIIDGIALGVIFVVVPLFRAAVTGSLGKFFEDEINFVEDGI
jgi:hypothetical protein